MDSPITFSLQELPDRDALDEAREEAQDKLAESGSKLASMKWPIFRDAAENCMKEELGNIDPFAMLAGAWGTAIELQALAAKTRAAPGTKQPYPLGKHKLSASVHPVVTLRCGPLTFPGLTFTVTVEGLVECAVLIIAEGRLHSIDALSLTPSAVLSYGTKVLKRLPGPSVTPGRPYVFSNGGLEIFG
jgi:hypothetical protein